MAVERSEPRRVLILGASGFLGSNFALSQSPMDDVVLHSSSSDLHISGSRTVSCNLAQPGAGRSLVRDIRPDVVVNCVALADVDQCELRPTEADRLNRDLPAELADACGRFGARLVHISTDAVFGAGSAPYFVTSPTGPINYYGRSKAEGEQHVLSANSSALVVRTCVIGWSPTGRRSLLEYFVNRLESRVEAVGFTNVKFRPISASDLWPLIRGLLDDRVTGIVHATGDELMSKFDFGRRVADIFEFDASLLTPAVVEGSGLVANRAANLDVVPTATVVSTGTDCLSIDAGLRRLRTLATMGLRSRLRSLTNTRLEAP